MDAGNLLEGAVDADDSRDAVAEHCRRMDGVAHAQPRMPVYERASLEQVRARDRQQVREKGGNVLGEERAVRASSTPREDVQDFLQHLAIHGRLQGAIGHPAQHL